MGITGYFKKDGTYLPLYLALTNTAGYLLSTVPQIIIDPLLKTHVAYGPRTYPYAWCVVPISSLLFVITLLIFPRKRSNITVFSSIIPLILALIISIPIFKPEIPHAVLLSNGTIWLLITSVWIGLRSINIHDTSINASDISMEARIEYIKEQLKLWRTLFFGLLAGLLPLIVVAIVEINKYSATFLKDESEIFINNNAVRIQICFWIMFIVFAIFVEVFKKMGDISKMLFEINE